MAFTLSIGKCSLLGNYRENNEDSIDVKQFPDMIVSVVADEPRTPLQQRHGRYSERCTHAAPHAPPLGGCTMVLLRLPLVVAIVSAPDPSRRPPRPTPRTP